MWNKESKKGIRWGLYLLAESSPRRRRHTGSGCSSSPIKSPGVMWSPKIFKPSPKARAQPRSMSDRNSSSQATGCTIFALKFIQRHFCNFSVLFLLLHSWEYLLCCRHSWWSSWQEACIRNGVKLLWWLEWWPDQSLELQMDPEPCGPMYITSPTHPTVCGHKQGRCYHFLHISLAIELRLEICHHNEL